jgi:lipoprotein-anchoring transpeptidase ErfK/SrfK
VKHGVVTLLALSTFATTTVAHSAPELVGFVQTFRAGTIVVRKHERQLYYVTEAGQIVRYPVGVGHFVPYGCIRMFNEDVEDLYRRVGVGTPVIVE